MPWSKEASLHRRREEEARWAAMGIVTAYTGHDKKLVHTKEDPLHAAIMTERVAWRRLAELLGWSVGGGDGALADVVMEHYELVCRLVEKLEEGDG